MSTEKKKAAARLIPEEERLDFLPGHFKYFLNFENGVYAWMNHLCREYDGGYWEFYETKNGAPFMVPSGDGEYHLENDINCCEATMSAYAAGLVVSVFAIADLMNAGRETERMVAYYERLMDYIEGQPEAGKIYALLD